MTSGASNRRRLDTTLVQRGLVRSRHRAQQLVAAGAVTVDGQVATKPAAPVGPQSHIMVADAIPYVSRGGLKLAAALDRFGVDVRGLEVADVGASTGGFTDCMLQRGAAHVYAIDVGHGQLAERLRHDTRVSAMEDTDIRQVRALPRAAHLAVVDVAFISLRQVLPAVVRLLRAGGQVIALVKPQFEVGPAGLDSRGVVRDTDARSRVLEQTLAWLAGQGWRVLGCTESPIAGEHGNVEYLVYFTTAAGEDTTPPASGCAGGQALSRRPGAAPLGVVGRRPS